MKQVEVTILGQSYLLGCPDGGRAPVDLDGLVRRLDMALGADGQLL